MTSVFGPVLRVIRQLTSRELDYYEDFSVEMDAEICRAEFEESSDEEKAHAWCTCYHLGDPTIEQEKQGIRVVVNFHEYQHHEGEGNCFLYGCDCMNFELLTYENTPSELVG